MRESIAETPIRFVTADYYFDRAELASEVIPSKVIRNEKSHRLN